MPSHFHKKFHWGTVFATGRMSFIEPETGLKMKRTNRRTRVLIGLYPCHIEEKMTIKEVKGESVMEWKTKKHGSTYASKPNPGSEPITHPDIATIITQQLQNIIPQIVTQVTANVNNGNGGNGNGGNDGCSYKTFTACNPKEFDGKGGAVALTRWIEKMESVFENSDLLVEDVLSKQWDGEWEENEFWNHTMVGANNVAYTSRFHELAKLVPHLVTPESSRIKRYIHGLAPQIRGCAITGQKPGHFARQCWAPIRQVAPVNAVNCGGRESERMAMNVGVLTIFTMIAPNGNKQLESLVEACRIQSCAGNIFQQSFATVLFDSGADFSFISTKFAPLLNVEPCIVNPGYAIKIADGKSVEVERVIRDCKLELGNSLFTIDLYRWVMEVLM
ncbi:putative reverse transcriptase domain-containing protein [Tanacetum coccineum]